MTRNKIPIRRQLLADLKEIEGSYFFQCPDQERPIYNQFLSLYQMNSEDDEDMEAHLEILRAVIEPTGLTEQLYEAYPEYTAEYVKLFNDGLIPGHHIDTIKQVIAMLEASIIAYQKYFPK